MAVVKEITFLQRWKSWVGAAHWTIGDCVPFQEQPCFSSPPRRLDIWSNQSPGWEIWSLASAQCRTDESVQHSLHSLLGDRGCSPWGGIVLAAVTRRCRPWPKYLNGAELLTARQGLCSTELVAMVSCRRWGWRRRNRSG